MSGYVALRLLLPDAVGTWFVTDSRTSPFESRIVGPAETGALHDHGAIAGEPGTVAGIGERASVATGQGPFIAQAASARSIVAARLAGNFSA